MRVQEMMPGVEALCLAALPGSPAVVLSAAGALGVGVLGSVQISLDPRFVCRPDGHNRETNARILNTVRIDFAGVFASGHLAVGALLVVADTRWDWAVDTGPVAGMVVDMVLGKAVVESGEAVDNILEPRVGNSVQVVLLADNRVSLAGLMEGAVRAAVFVGLGRLHLAWLPD